MFDYMYEIRTHEGRYIYTIEDRDGADQFVKVYSPQFNRPLEIRVVRHDGRFSDAA